MNVFLTGATGFVGSAVVAELLNAGFRVLGLARSERAAKKLEAAGAAVQRGDLTDLPALRSAAERSDAVIHTAFIHDFSNFEESGAIDARAIAALGEALTGSDRPLIVTSGIATTAQGRSATEDDPPVPATDAYPRRSEATAESLRSRGIHTLVVRLPPTVHGVGDHAFVPMLFATAARTGVSAYVEQGDNRWAAVHRLDAARVFRLALQAPSSVTRLHAVAEEGIRLRQIAEAIGQRLKVPVASISREQASAHFGFLAPFVDVDLSATSSRTRTLLGWQPQQPSLLADIAQPEYFLEEVSHA